MEYKLENHGDWLEKKMSPFIKQKIPAYELIWQNFIGHNGEGEIGPMNAASPEIEKVRMNFAQYHYTILDSLFFINKIEENIKLHRFKVKNINDYCEYLNQLMLITTYSGRIRDNIIDCFSSLISLEVKQIKETYLDSLENLYDRRNTLLHGRKMPFSLDENKCLLIPKVGNPNNRKYNWGRSTPWSEVTQSECVYAYDDSLQFIEELYRNLGNILHNLYSYVKNYLKDNSLIIKPPKAIEYINSPISGSTQMGTQGAYFYD